MAIIYEAPLTKRFLAPRVSFAWLFKLISWAVIIILPFLLAYWSHSLWKKREIFREQPLVAFTHKVVVVAELGQAGEYVAWSSVREVNAVLDPSSVRAVQVRSVVADTNVDEKPDHVNVSVVVPLEAGESVYRVHAALFFKLQLSKRVRLTMDSMAYVTAQSPLPGAEYTAFGDLLFRQRAPLSVTHNRKVYADPILDASKVDSVQDVVFPTLLGTAFARNESTVFDTTHSYWQSGSDSEFRMNLHIRIPVQNIEYIPDAFEALKFGWIQYLAIYAVIYFFVDIARNFIYTHQLIPTRVRRSDVPATKQHQF